jgi:small subunit ribosomal protein S18
LAREQQRGGRKRRKKVCAFCADARGKIIDYKNVGLLRRFVDERGKIRKARSMSTCRSHQRKLSTAIKRAREMALLPYTMDQTGG